MATSNFGLVLPPSGAAASQVSDSDATNAKIVGAATGVLTLGIMLIALLHLYLRWISMDAQYSDQQGRNQGRPGHSRFFSDEPLRSLGLSKAVLESLPNFTFSKKQMIEGMECSVCLCEFQEGEHGRMLSRCSHGFHTACIDMWFLTHSTCPLCRASVADDPPFYAYLGTGLDNTSSLHHSLNYRAIIGSDQYCDLAGDVSISLTPAFTESCASVILPSTPYANYDQISLHGYDQCSEFSSGMCKSLATPPSLDLQCTSYKQQRSGSCSPRKQPHQFQLQLPSAQVSHVSLGSNCSTPRRYNNDFVHMKDNNFVRAASPSVEHLDPSRDHYQQQRVLDMNEYQINKLPLNHEHCGSFRSEPPIMASPVLDLPESSKSPLSHMKAIRRILSMREQRVAPFTPTAGSPRLICREC